MIPVILWTDALVYLLVISVAYILLFKRKTPLWTLIFQKIVSQKRYTVALIILATFSLMGFLDTLHFKKDSKSHDIFSVFDIMLQPRNTEKEITYSAPFAVEAYTPELTKTADGTIKEIYPRLEYAGQHLSNANILRDIGFRTLKGLIIGIIISLGLFLCLDRLLKNRLSHLIQTSPYRSLSVNQSLKTIGWTFAGVIITSAIVYSLMFEYHVLGTDKVGRDVLYIALKSIRTGLVIGTLTTMISLPFSLILGMMAGYYRGIVDDLIQYLYVTLSSIPGILLIAAAVLSFQVKIEQDPDLKLLVLCIILGVTSWTSLCRYLRAETLKLREMEFVQAAKVLGVKQGTILRRHIMPNLMHVVIITLVLDFSGLVLAEAILTYVGIGVDPTTPSWGNMINAARLEMARDPMVWWSLAAALTLMFVLVFSANIFSDAIQDALNPRSEK